LVLVVSAATACSYDWSLAPTSDAGATDGAPIDAARFDASTPDATASDAGTIDASADAPSPPNDASGGGDAQSCAALFRQVDDTRAAAKKCTSTATACTTHLADPCGCVTVVAQPANAEDSAYLSAVNALKGSGCPLACSVCPVAHDGLCVLLNGGPTTACSQ
jgi:hypothetical protein